MKEQIRISQEMLHLAGEYRVCSELLKRNVFATITYGNRKSADLYVIDDRNRRALRVEVKTSQTKKFVTGFSQKKTLTDPTSSLAPDFWVLFHLRKETKGEEIFKEQFFILTHQELRRVQQAHNAKYAARHKRKHGKEWDHRRGVDKISLVEVSQPQSEYRDAWEKIIEAARR